MINENTTLNDAAGTGKQTGRNNERPLRAMNDAPVLLDNDTTYGELTLLLRKYEEATKAADIELKRQSIEIREEKRKAVLGEDYEESEDVKEAKAKYRRPRWNQLRTNKEWQCIARMEMSQGGICEAFSNGYAIYFNGSRHAILWIPEYSGDSYTYYHPLRDSEKQFLTEKEEVPADLLEAQPWYLVLLMRGEDQIEFRMQHPKSKGEMCTEEDMMDEELQKAAKKGTTRNRGSHIPTPEEAYLKKEEWEEQMAVLTEEEREAFILYHNVGYRQEEIAEMLNVSQKSVSRYLQRARKKIREMKEQETE